MYVDPRATLRGAPRCRSHEAGRRRDRGARARVGGGVGVRRRRGHDGGQHRRRGRDGQLDHDLDRHRGTRARAARGRGRRGHGHRRGHARDAELRDRRRHAAGHVDDTAGYPQRDRPEDLAGRRGARRRARRSRSPRATTCSPRRTGRQAAAQLDLYLAARGDLHRRRLPGAGQPRVHRVHRLELRRRQRRRHHRRTTPQFMPADAARRSA